MHFDPSQSPAQEFLGGLGDILYPKEVGSAEDDFKYAEEDNQIVISEKEKQKKTDRSNPKEIESEITKIFSSAHSVPVLKGRLRETLSKAVLSQPGKDLPERLRSVDRHVRLFFASNFADLSTAASRYYDPQIEYLNEHPIIKQPGDPEITLGAIFKALDITKNEIGTKLAQDIVELKKLGLKDYADKVENFLYAFGNGSSNLGDFIKSIGTLKDDLSKDQLRAVKRSLTTLVTASTRLQKISVQNKQLLVDPSKSSFKEIEDGISKNYPKESFPVGLSSEKLIDQIERFEREVFEQMQNRGLYFNKKKENIEIKDEPPFIEVIRKKIIEKLEPSQLIQILESKKEAVFKENNSLNHWKQLCFEAMKGKEVEYLNHLNDPDIDWKNYPWDVFHIIAQNCPVAQRVSFAQFFEDHVYEIPKNQLAPLVDIFFGTFYPAIRESFVKAILVKCNTERNPLAKSLSFLFRVNLSYKDKVRSEWNNLILNGINFEGNNLKTIARLMCSMIKLGAYSIYFQILNYIKNNKPEALLEQFRQHIVEYSKIPENQLTDKEEGTFSISLLNWCWHYLGSFDRDFYDSAIITPTKSYERAASMRFKDRTKPANEDVGLPADIASKLEGEALGALSDSLPKGGKIEVAASLIQKRMKDSEFCSKQLNAIVSSPILKVEQSVIREQKMAVVKFFLEKVEKLKDFPEDFLFIPAGVFGHTMQLTIIKHSQGVGKEPKLSVYITNTGSGIQVHPSIEGPPTKYSTTAKIGEITQKTLEDPNFWERLVNIFTEVPDLQKRKEFTSTQISSLYSTLKIACGKRDSSLQMIEHSGNFYPVKREQLGGVCTVSCIRDITKTLFDLILYEQAKDKGSTGSFADSYLESELVMERLDHWIAKGYLKPDNATTDISGKELKLSKKGASSFEKFAAKELFPQTRQFLINQIDQIYGRFSRIHREPMKKEPSLGESAREIKDLTKELVLAWIKGNKKIGDVESFYGHPILEVAKKRFEYKQRAIQEALAYIEKMEKGNTSEKDILFILNIFKELQGIGAENIIIDQLKRSISKMVRTSENAFLTSENALCLSELINLMNKDETSRVNAVELFKPYLERMIGKTAEVELSYNEYNLLGSFFLIAKEKVLDLLKPAFENFSKRPLTIAEFYLFREALGNTSETLQTKIIENLVSEGKRRDPKLTPKEIIFPFILTFKLIAADNKLTIYNDTIAHLISVTEKYLDSSEDKEYLESLLLELQRERR